MTTMSPYALDMSSVGGSTKGMETNPEAMGQTGMMGTLKGILGGAGNMLQNPMFLSALGNAGQGIASGNFAGQMNKMLQQQIQTQAYRNLLQQILGDGGKITLGEDGTSIKIPKSQKKGASGMQSLGDMQTPSQFYADIFAGSGVTPPQARSGI